MSRKTLMFGLGLMSLAISTSAFASPWRDLWLRADQRGAALFEQQQFAAAATTFADPNWQGSAYYRAQKYVEAEQAFAVVDTPQATYNRANALAQQQKFAEAIALYEKVLAEDAQYEDAKFNRDLLKKYLEQQQQDQQSQSKQQDQEQNQEQNQDQNQEQQSDQSEKSATEAAQKEDDQPPPKPQAQAAAERKQQESKQSQQQWLKQIPDDPGGLLKQKFLRDHLRMQTE